MKTWEAAEITELEICKTEYKWLGNTRDGGYIGDGILSGHMKWCNPNPPVTPPGDDTDILS